ncbi:MAG: LUD domain-containing protein [Methanomassiliicoccales archaeon]|nr:LUD domain-containing protein [Methanomassiliicoccales archaeon]
MADAAPDREPWNKRIREKIAHPAQLDGMRAAFKTTLDRQEENLPRLPNLEERRKRAKEAREVGVRDGRLLSQAIERLRANKIRVLGPFSKNEAQEAILSEIGLERLVVKSKSNVTKELELAKFLGGKGVRVIETDAGDRIIQLAGLKQAHPTGPAVDLTRYDVAKIMSKYLGREVDPDPDSLTQVIREDVRQFIEEAGVGITGANFIAAEEGAAIILHNEGNAAECARRPIKHIIVASTDKVVADLEEAMNLVKLQAYYATGKLVTQYINIISGPSMTADIEKKTFYGMHGPKEVVLVLVDNNRSRVLDRTILECINCGSCLLRCPVYDAVGKDFGGPAYLGGRGAAFTAYIDDAPTAVSSGLTLCTNCGLCTEMCPVRLDVPSHVRQARRLAAGSGLLPTPEQKALVKSVRNYHNPWMQPRQAKGRWAEGLRLPAKGDVLFFAGCSPALLHPEMPRAVVEVLRSAGLEVAYLGKEEVCCGSTLQKIGEEEQFLRTAEESAKLIRASGAKRIVTSCPGCYRTLKEYHRYLDGFEVEVEHASQTLVRLLDEGRLRFKGVKAEVTYHDPCELGRLGGVIEEPRKVLESIPGLVLREMQESKARSQCCGSGGGVKTAHPDLATSIGARRIAAAQGTGAKALVTSCPWCLTNLRDSCKSSGSDIEIWDLIVLAKRSLSG